MGGSGIARDNRQFINTVFWIIRTGVLWCGLSQDYGDWSNTTVVLSAGAIRGYGRIAGSID